MMIIDWPTIVAAAGIQTQIVDGFATRSHGELTDKVGIVWHHDASPAGPTGQWLSSSWDAGEPSAQIWVDTFGTWWFIGAGQAWHAGDTDPTIGANNSNTVGIETDHTTGEAWPDALLASLQMGTAAIMKAKSMDPNKDLYFHKQIAIPVGRKQDPDGLELDQQKAAVVTKMGGVPAGGTTPSTGTNVPVTTAPDVFKQGVFSYLYEGKGIDNNSLLFTGELAPVNDQQLIATVQSICSSSLRSFMSGPDGSFIAFFPDYFGIYQDPNGAKGYKLILEDIELINFKINVNDNAIATDVFVTGDNMSSVGTSPIDVNMWLASSGVVNIRQSSALACFLGDKFATDFKPDDFYARFGIRPYKAEYPFIYKALMEYLQALAIFQKKWSEQFSTVVEFAFMPELQPGMRILIKSLNITVYVEEVVHTGSYDTGFFTSATISSPAGVDGGGIYSMVAGV